MKPDHGLKIMHPRRVWMNPETGKLEEAEPRAETITFDDWLAAQTQVKDLQARLDKATELLRRALHWGPSGNDDTGADIRAFLDERK